MNRLHLVHYCHPDCEPLQNIMRLPEREAFALAARLSETHPETTAFYRFADFHNYYPRRLEADSRLRTAFLSRGGQPAQEHPLSFVLEGSDYLDTWFGLGKVLQLPLRCVPEEQISFTLGDSLSTLEHTGAFSLLTLADLRSRITGHPEGASGFLRDARLQHHYIEAQLWDDTPCRYIERIR